MLAVIGLLLLSLSVSNAQDLTIPDNPYEITDSEASGRKAFLRQRWFYEQRMYPDNFIPEDAYGKAVRQKDLLRTSRGFSMTGLFDTWTSIGPTTGFYFDYSNITSRMTSVKYDPVNPNIIYAGSANGGVWKSYDAGSTWTAMSDYEASLACGSLAIDPTNTNIIYFGTGEATYSVVSYYGRGLLKSTDGGTTWSNSSQGLPAASYNAKLVIRPNYPSQLLAAMSYDGLYRSTNSGATWNRILSGRCDDVVFSPTGDTAYATGSGTGYVISVNGGASFTVNSSLTMQERNQLAICRSMPAVLYCATYNAGNISVFKSTNAGQNYFQVSAGHNFEGVQGWYDFYMHVNPFDANTAYVGSIDVWRTTNGGTNFSNITFGYGGGIVHVDQHNIDFHPTNSNQMLCVNDGGIWKSTNRGTNWINLNTNHTLTQFYRIAADPSNASHVMGGTQDNGTQRTTGSLNWYAAYGGDGGEVCFHEKNNSYILGETQGNGVFRSTDGGTSFSGAGNGLYGNAAWIGPIISHPDSGGVFYTAREQVFKSTNWGAAWSAISSGTSGTIRELAIGRSSGNVMYATSEANIFRSTNRGYTFYSVTNGLPNAVVTSVYSHPDSPLVAIATFSGFGNGKIFKTTNGGSSWNNVSGNLPDSPANDALIFYPGMSTSVYYIATDVGVFVTNNYGQVWVELANGLPNTVVMHLDYHRTSNKLRAGTHGRGVFEIQLNSAVADVQAYSIGDAGIKYYASNTVNPKGTVRNNAPGSATFTSVRKISPGGYMSTKTVSNLASGATAEVTHSSWTFIPGTTYTVRDSVYIAGDLNNLNNTASGTLTPYLGEYITLLSEGFQSTAFPPAGWMLIPGGAGYLSRSAVSSYGIGTGSVKCDNWNYNPGTSQSLVTPTFSPALAGDSIRFDHAYSPYNNNVYTDSLIIEVSTNGGSTYSVFQKLWGNSDGGPLNSTGVGFDDFVPNANQWASKSYALPPSVNKIKFRAVSGFGNNLYLDSIRLQTVLSYTQFSISLIPEGYYNSVTGKLNRRDTVRAYLMNAVSPFSPVDSAVALIDSLNFTGAFIFRNAPTGTYYLRIIHRNSIETWSKAGGESMTRGSLKTYDFTSSASQAYGSNEKLRSGKWCLFSGDVDRDGAIDATDLALIDNDAYAFASGYISTDLTGDDFTDATDYAVADNNASLFTGVIRP